MYCRYCGKELPNDSNFCHNCGKKVKDSITLESVKTSKFVEFMRVHKKALYLYFSWLLLNVCLLIFAIPKGTNQNGSIYRADFYPFTRPLAEIFEGKNFYVNILKVERYDFSELFFYVVLLPCVIFGMVKCFQRMPTLFKKLRGYYVPSKGMRLKSGENDSDVKKMTLLPRLLGSFIDKFLILILFVLVSVAISPYGAPGRLGIYYGLRNTPPSLYEYIDRGEMSRYGTYSEGISKHFQDMERLESLPPHIGYTFELDMSITFMFILLNIIYYVLFESLLSASLGKWIFKGILIDGTNRRIGIGKALSRGLCGGALMAGTYLFLHLLGGLTNIVVVIIFFLLLDIPVLFTKNSLLDLCTRTMYVKR